ARALAGAEGDPALLIGFRVTGAGASADSARVSGRVDLTAVRDTGAAVPVGHATLRLADGRLDLRPLLLAAGGRITAIALVTLGDTLRYEIRDGGIEGVHLGHSGDTTSAPLSGRFGLAGRGTAPREAQVTAKLHVDELRYGGRQLGGAEAVARLDGGRLRVEGAAALQGGRLTIEALG